MYSGQQSFYVNHYIFFSYLAIFGLLFIITEAYTTTRDLTILHSNTLLHN